MSKDTSDYAQAIRHIQQAQYLEAVGRGTLTMYIESLCEAISQEGDADVGLARAIIRQWKAVSAGGGLDPSTPELIAWIEQHRPAAPTPPSARHSNRTII